MIARDAAARTMPTVEDSASWPVVSDRIDSNVT